MFSLAGISLTIPAVVQIFSLVSTLLLQEFCPFFKANLNRGLYVRLSFAYIEMILFSPLSQ